MSVRVLRYCDELDEAQLSVNTLRHKLCSLRATPHPSERRLEELHELCRMDSVEEIWADRRRRADVYLALVASQRPSGRPSSSAASAIPAFSLCGGGVLETMVSCPTMVVPRPFTHCPTRYVKIASSSEYLTGGQVDHLGGFGGMLMKLRRVSSGSMIARGSDGNGSSFRSQRLCTRLNDGRTSGTPKGDDITTDTGSTIHVHTKMAARGPRSLSS